MIHITTGNLVAALGAVGIGSYLLGMLIGFACGYFARKSSTAQQQQEGE